ncbi:hypothetical protein Aple_070610 [Acrocarpospora pleiomorpha]|uniref:LTD domain-containing protein n=1 Tax=Acrocarpospora pleiomorpha TaxID=90975 RepID=A0A5M3XT39_9ACTN|nr:hypothetical protein Aple_070610 [Acrocarpospora pleiomorpha]
MRLSYASLAVSLVASALIAARPAHAATPVVQFIRVWYDSPGKDYRGNSSLNAEYVIIKNTTRKVIDLENWVLRDETGYKYIFGPVTLRAGKRLVVRTGQGEDTATTVYWNRKQYVWNNDGDTATLRNATGKKIDTCGWTKLKPGYTNCS